MIVGRELCLFLTVDASKIPVKQRANFIALAVRRAAPFQDPAHETAWAGAHAAVWYWSRARIAELMGPQSLQVTRFLPESLLVGQPPDGSHAELLELAHGYEGRVWEQGRLIADRWWAAHPEPTAWATFLRGAGQSSTAHVNAIPASIGPAPWAQRSAHPGLAIGDVGTWIKRGALAAGVIACVMLGFESGAGMRGLTDTWASERDRKQLDAPLTRILEARADAEREAEELRHLLGLRAPQGQINLLAEVKKIMPGQDWRIVLWSQPAMDRLDVTFSMDNPDATALVSAWEASPMFSDVSSNVEQSAKRITLRAKVLNAADDASATAGDAGGDPT